MKAKALAKRSKANPTKGERVDWKRKERRTNPRKGPWIYILVCPSRSGRAFIPLILSHNRIIFLGPDQIIQSLLTLPTLRVKGAGPQFVSHAYTITCIQDATGAAATVAGAANVPTEGPIYYFCR